VAGSLNRARALAAAAALKPARAAAAAAALAATMLTGLDSAGTPATVSAAPERPAVSVYPTPGDSYELRHTQISFRGIAPSQIGSVTVVGSKSGVHPGLLVPHSDGKGASLIPTRPFATGETVTVSTGLSVIGGKRGRFSFGIEHPGPPLPGSALPRAKGTGGVQRFRTYPGLSPPAVVVTKNRAPASDGDIFVAPQFGPEQNGPMILDPHGNLVWFQPYPLSLNTLVTDFRVQRLFGQPVLTWWQGSINTGSGRGVGLIVDQHYRPIAAVRAGNGLEMDLHEFLVTNQGTAWIIAIAPMRLPGVSRTVQNGVIQEIDVRTGLVLFQWDGMDHVPPSSSYRWGSKIPGRVLGPWHINSISLDSRGNPVISMRNTNAVYDIDRSTGRINWELGGKHSSFKMGRGTSTAFQHDAIIHRGNQLTIFDDGAGPPRIHGQSRGIRVAVDTRTHRSKLIQVYPHNPPISSTFEGSIQTLPNDNVFLGWGQQPYFSQDMADGREDFSAHFKVPTTSYRAYRFPWHGQPLTPPALAVGTGPGGALTVYASWNGATDVTAWRVLTGNSPGALRPGPRQARQRFQTVIKLHTQATCVAVQALGASGQVLGTSAVKTLPGYDASASPGYHRGPAERIDERNPS
jgi:hypothetical protein